MIEGTRRKISEAQKIFMDGGETMAGKKFDYREFRALAERFTSGKIDRRLLIMYWRLRQRDQGIVTERREDGRK
jgi:hypothetical protein